MSAPDQKPPMTKKTSWTIIALFALFFVVTISTVAIARKSLRPVFFGIGIAYLMKSMCNVLYRLLLKGISKRRTPLEKDEKLVHIASIVLTYVVWFTIISLFLVLILPRIGEGLMALVTALPEFINNSLVSIARFLEENRFFGEHSEQIIQFISESFNSWYAQELKPLLTSLAATMINGISGTFTLLLDLFIGFIVSAYLLNGRKKLAAQAKLTVHAAFEVSHANMIINEARFADRMFSGFFVGKLIDSSIVGVLCYLGMLALRLPYPLLIAVIVGITDIIPFFGPYIGAIPSALIILTVSPWQAVVFLLMAICLQQLDGNILCPKIVGNTTGLSAFWVLFAILLFGGLFGFVGMLIGVPVFAVIYDVIGKLIRHCLHKRGSEHMLASYYTEYPRETAPPIHHRLRYRVRREMLPLHEKKTAPDDTQETDKNQKKHNKPAEASPADDSSAS